MSSSIGSPPHFLRQGLSLILELIDKLGCPVRSRDPLTLFPKHWDCTCTPQGLDFIGAGDPNSDPQSHVACTSLTQHLPAPPVAHLNLFMPRPSHDASQVLCVCYG